MRRVLGSLLLAVMSFAGGVIYIVYRCGYILENRTKKADKFLIYFKFFDRWLTCKEQNYDFAEYFNKRNITNIAIYGMGRLGKHLKYELEKAGIKIDYVVDEGEKVIYGDKVHYNLHDSLPLTDVVIVTPIDEFEEIRSRLIDNNKLLKVVSIDKVIGDN